MKAQQSIFKTRREYNKWVANQTLEDFSLRFTAKKARKLSVRSVGKTALGATAFLALEALAAAATLQYGFINTLYAMLAVAAAIFLTGVPITYHAARNGLDIDLLTRGAGFGYLGSTITSLVYASFTFIFFAIEAAILASAFQALFHIPLAIGYILCVIIVIPIVTHGITAISRFQIGTQPIWLILQCTALFVVAYFEHDKVSSWVQFSPPTIPSGEGFNLALFGSCSAIFFALIAQIGEQVDYLRFLPDKTKNNRASWWFWMLLSGPGWISIGLLKMLFGSFLAYLAFSQLAPFERATDPVYMYQMAYGYLTQSPSIALLLAGIMVIISQMKINVTNAYAGSIAWSNFFSRLTHNHPGRVVWLVFNMLIALTLMELGIYRVLEAIIGIFALVAISWLACLSADLLINKSFGLSPKKIEFKRSHLYDINPVGFGSMILATCLGMGAYLGYFGENAKYLAHYISLGSSYIFVPAIALLTKGKYYLAREEIPATQVIDVANNTPHTCNVCENTFDAEDMSHCPAYGAQICSLCCSLDARCLDMCKQDARISDQINNLVNKYMPGKKARPLDSKILRFLSFFLCIALANATLLALIYFHYEGSYGSEKALLSNTLWTLFYVTSIVFGVLAWIILLAHDSRRIAQQESNHQTRLLIDEIEAHKETDAALQNAKEIAEKANEAKSRYLSGISHELRTPLQSVLGYAQLLQQKKDMPEHHLKTLNIIYNSGEHLSNLIEGLLEISKIEAGRLEIFIESIDIKALLDQLSQIFTSQADEKGIEFHTHYHNTLPKRVKADKKRINQILINLLSNAIKYTEEGRVDFHVHYRNQVAQFTIEDTGVGIHSKDLERILKPFERVRNENVPNVTGTGLGLTISKLLTDILGGELAVSSTPGNGSCFSLSLMLSSIESPLPEIISEKEIVGYSGRVRSILVVDDNPLHRGLISHIFQPIGFTVYEAQNARECLESLNNVTPDMMIIDVNMPGDDGLQLAEKLRGIGYSHPILMLSADAIESHTTNETTIPVYDLYMTKPILNKNLIERVGELLKIDWRFESNIKKPSEQKKEIPLERLSPFNSAPPELFALLNASKIGHKRGVLESIEALKKHSHLPTNELAKLAHLAEAMRFEKIEKLIEDSLIS